MTGRVHAALEKHGSTKGPLFPAFRRREPVPAVAHSFTPQPASACPAAARGFNFGTLPLQPKLNISQPGDVYEQEADRVADTVMQMPDQVIQRKAPCPEGAAPCEEEEENVVQAQTKPLEITPLVQRQTEKLPEEEEKKKEEEKTTVQTKEAVGRTSELNPNLESQVSALRGGGHPLPGSVRSFFEPRFGHDFSKVRVHHDAQATESARAVNARAFTVGSNIIFGRGEYRPETEHGAWLLSHELSHVIQQGEAKPAPGHRLTRPPSISTRHGGQPVVARKADVEESVDKLTKQNRKPKDLEPAEAAEIGREALRTVQYEDIIKIAVQAGILKQSSAPSGPGTIRRKEAGIESVIMRQAAEAVTFGGVFSGYAVAAGIASQVDSPAPGPGDVVALGILIVGLAVAGYTVYMARRRTRETTRTAERVEPTTAGPPPPDLCRKAIKILTQYERLARDLGRSLPPNRLAELNRLRDAGEITINHLPGSLRREFPGQFVDMTLSAIRVLCGM